MLKIPRWDVLNPSWVTWVHTITRDAGSSEPLGQLQCEEHVAQFAVAVGLEELPAEAASAQVLVHRQRLSNNTTQQNQHGSTRVCREVMTEEQVTGKNVMMQGVQEVSGRNVAWGTHWVLPLRNKSQWRQITAQLEEPVLNMWQRECPWSCSMHPLLLKGCVLQKD